MGAIREQFELMVKAWNDPFHRFMLAHGRDYAIGPETFSGPRGESGLCYMNATHLAQRERALTYVEGQVDLFGVPIDHAWCVTADGVVIDPTLEPANADGTFDRVNGYFGVPLRTDYVIKACLTNGFYGLLDAYQAHKTLPKLVELGLDAGQQWLLDHKGEVPGRRRGRC